MHSSRWFSASGALLIIALVAPATTFALTEGISTPSINASPMGTALPANIGEGTAAYLTPSQMLDIPGATGALTNPACVAETSARAARKQPPPNGDFPCTPIPASNGSGFVYGVCFATVCKGTSFSLLGAITSFLSNIPLSAIAGAILSKIMAGGQDSSSGGAPILGTSTKSELIPSLNSQFILTDSTEPLDTSILLAQSDKIVEDLNSSLNPPGTQVPI